MDKALAAGIPFGVSPPDLRRSEYINPRVHRRVCDHNTPLRAAARAHECRNVPL